MRVIIAPQGLKGSLSASETGAAIAQGVHAVYPEAETIIIPIADGGEGTVQALVDATKGKLVYDSVTGPLGQPVQAFYGILNNRTAVIEMAACAGLPQVPPEQRDPRYTTTYGVGELIKAAYVQGCRHFIIGIGGSATNDGGAGMAQALGASLTNTHGKEIGRGGAALADLAHISIANIPQQLRACTFDVACDVTNPLCGPQGATAIYGPQKGATPEMVKELDQYLAHYANIIERDIPDSKSRGRIADIPGAGAAGGLGAGLIAFLGATLRPGAQIVLEAVQLEQQLQQGADLVITAEGQLDAQTAFGKSVGAVAQMAKQYQCPVLALGRGLGKNYQEIYNLGIDAVAVLPQGPVTLAYSMKHAAELTTDSIERALRLIRLGSQLSTPTNSYVSHQP